MKKVCQKHGEVEFRPVASKSHKDGKRWVCRSCVNERVSAWRLKSKAALVKLLGGSCVICGYSKSLWALEFHHSDPSVKEFTLSKYDRSIEAMKKEASKCSLVCANCHREIHHSDTL